MAYPQSSRPYSHHRGRGGFRGGSQDMSRNHNKKPVAILSTGSIFDTETPKAYAPLGYSIPEKPTVLRPEDFNNDSPLPACPVRPSHYITTPLGATFLDTESEKPGFPGASRNQTPRDNTLAMPDGTMDPTVKLVSANVAKKLPLTLGKQVISESNLETGTVYLERMLKRDREGTQEPEDTKQVKKQKRDFRIKFDGEEEGDINEDTVKPENVLRMVDSSLVDTPEKKYEEYQRRPVPAVVPPPAHMSLPHPPRYYDEYDRYRAPSRDREYQRDRERAREREREPPLARDRGDREYNVRDREPYPYKYHRDYKIPPNSAPSRPQYYDEYDYRYVAAQVPPQYVQHHRPTSSHDYYDRYYERYPQPVPMDSRRGPPPPPPPPPPIRRDSPYDYDEYAVPPPPPPPSLPPSGYNRQYDRPPRRYDDHRRRY